MVKVLTAKPGNLGLIPGTRVVVGEVPLPQVVLWSPQVHCGMHIQIHTKINTHKNN